MPAFEDFVNDELPRRLSIDRLPEGGNLPANRSLLTTGVGLTLKVASSTDDIQFYVDGQNGSDENGDGSQEEPWQTLSQALKQASQVMQGQNLTIYLAKGTYREKLNAPNNISGQINIIGKPQDPSLVILESIVDNVTSVFTHSNPNLTIHFDGISFRHGLKGLDLSQSASVILGTCYFNDLVLGIHLKDQSKLFFRFIGAQNSQFKIDQIINVSRAIIAESDSWIFIDQDIQALNYGTFIELVSSKLKSSLRSNLFFSNAGVASFGINLRQDSWAFIQGDLNFDGGQALNGNVALSVNKSQLYTGNGRNFNFDNFTYGLSLKNQSYIFSNNITWLYNDVNFPVQFDWSSSFESSNQFDQEAIRWEGSEEVKAGPSYKALNYNLLLSTV